MTSVEQVRIPEGYKETEVGVIPEDWKCIYFGELGDVVRGGSPRPAGDPKYFNGTFIPWLTVASLTNIKKSQQLVTTTKSMLTELGSFQSRILDKNTLIISNSGATLGVAKILGIKCCANDGVAALINQKKGNCSYLVHYLNTQTKRLHDDIATGNGQPNLNTDLIKLIPIPFPTENEQAAIANALSNVDSLIASLENLIAKKSAIKTAAMQQLLTGKKRLPAFVKQGAKQSSEPDSTSETAQAAQTKQTSTLNSDLYKESGEGLDLKSNQHSEVGNANNKQIAPRPGYKKTELGEIPEDWEVVGLGYLFEDKVIRKRISVQDDVTFIGMQDVSESAKIINSHKVKYSDVKSGFTYFERNDVLVAKITPCFENGKGAFTDVLETDVGFGSTEFHVLRATSNTDSKYLYYFTNTVKFRKELEGEMVGSAGHRRVPLSSIQTYQVAISKNKEEQTAIANVLSDMDTELDALQQRLSKTQQIKQGMMQELLTGKTRLPFSSDAKVSS